MTFSADYRMTINGELVDSDRTFAVIDPATEQTFAAAPDASDAQLNAAVDAARAAFPGWRAAPQSQRAKALEAMADALSAHQHLLSELLTQEQGKPLRDARAEIARSIDWLNQTARLSPPDDSRANASGRLHQVRRVPVGVVGAISPWNFPVSLAIWKIAPALLAGNTVVLKPSPFTPLATLRLGELFRPLLPAGVLNVISGGDALGPLMTQHTGIDKISFTGSTATGRAVMRSAAATLKKLTLELGGNDPAIILPDADVDAIAEKLFWSAFRNAGQVCVASKRIYVHDSLYDELKEALTRLAQANLPRAGCLEGATIGPVQNKAQFEKVRALIAATRAAGGKLIEPVGALSETGYFIAPTLVDNPPDDWPIVSEEPFGPVVPLLRYNEIDDAVARANASPYALGASVWGRDLERAAEVAERIEAGTVWINSAAMIDPLVPFGGRKQSGLGVEHGVEGLLEYTVPHVIAHGV